MLKTGTLSYQEFENELLDFIERAKNIQDSWNLEFPKGKSKARKFLVKRQVKPALSGHKESDHEINKPFPEENKWGVTENDEDCTVSVDQRSDVHGEFLKYEYHIVYSDSYSVPVLYFTACRHDGRLLSLKEVWENVPDIYHDRLEYEKWTFLTQQEHPYLGVPFYQLHPCHTADMMKRALSIDSDRPLNYLITWLSTVGPVVGLNLPLAYSV
ncbi:ubiquitin-like-conjugating enzyme ATG10 [Porites lutea]|uniref:ubiquitin-like-conjugating enzyme ATG10 n=1 Tax=Porites lutea TaxID=51062 RepID=UPI003CC6A554